MDFAHINPMPVTDPAGRSDTGRLTAIVRGHGPVVAVLAAGLVVRLLLLVASTSMELRIADEQQYAQLATNLVEGHGFAWGAGRPTSMRPPLYPLFVAGVWSLTAGENPQAVRAAQILLSLLTALAVYVLALRLFNRRCALIAAAVVCFYPSFLFSGMLVLTEVMFTLLLVLFALQYDTLMRRPSLPVALSVGITLGLAALTRSVLWPFVVVLLPLVFASVKGTLRHRAVMATCCLVGYVAFVGPWALRNTLLQRTPTIVDTMGGMNLRMGNYEYTPEDRMWDAVSITGEKSWAWNLSILHPEAAYWTDGQKDKWAQREGIAYIVANPGTAIRRSLLKFADFWGLEREMLAGLQYGLYQPPAWIMWMAIAAVVLSYPVVALLAAIGVCCSRPSEMRTHVLLITVAAFITAVHTVVFGHSRYHLPLIPFLGMYAAATLAEPGWRSLTAHRGRMVAAALACAVLVAVWAHEIFFRDAERIRAFVGLLT